ncbi:unnamed protein product [Triticum turgidum subsp. durum]|uniref:Uncharacterized protein n=1 Tax=Triticum turgidum subsp. durum TaxID=4567 RepID=A0A9R1QW87_TRITD|nr:unnamed protein product [Triticum turgidum subsp. durum]
MEVDGTPDLTDFMNDWFFGTVGVKHNAVAAGSPAYDLTGESSSSSKKKQSSEKKTQRAESEGGRSGGGSRASNASKQTQEWLEEAKRMMVGSGSPGRMGSPSRQVPKFAGGNGTEPSPALDRRDPMSRSARSSHFNIFRPENLHTGVSSIVAAICYAWMQSSKGDGQAAAVPVVNMRRSRMTGCRQAAWLLYHVGVDASALLFADEVDMEGLIMDQRASLLVVGQDVLRSNGEAGSVCTLLANDHSEEAYALLQSLDIKKLLVGGVFLTCSSDHLMLDHNEHSFVEFLKNTYRKSSTDGAGDSPPEQKNSVSGASQDAKKSNSANQKPARGKPSEEAPQGKNKFSLAKFFGFGRK